MAPDLSQLSFFLSSISSVAVIFGAIFIIFQLRQNAKLINATMQENKSGIAFEMVERIIDDSFVRRRKNVYDLVKKYGEKNWEGFVGTFEDFEARNYAYMYELFGQLVKDGILELKTVMDVLKYIVVNDWRIMEPMLRHLNKHYGLEVNPWANFEWLAHETEKYLASLAEKVPPPPLIGPDDKW